MNRTVFKILAALFIILAAGILIPKFVIKNPDLSSNSCAKTASHSEPKFPAWLIWTPKVESFTDTEINTVYYTIFGIKTAERRITFCTLAK